MTFGNKPRRLHNAVQRFPKAHPAHVVLVGVRVRDAVRDGEAEGLAVSVGLLVEVVDPVSVRDSVVDGLPVRSQAMNPPEIDANKPRHYPGRFDNV